jgi:antitoxin component YwqK of YwqJK toxin-antitoxin module
MAQQVQLRNKIFVFGFSFSFTACCFFLLQCSQEKMHASFILQKINTATVSVQTKQGITYINNTAANAIVYQLYENDDTAFIITYNNGKMEGQPKYWYDNKQLKEVRNFIQGKQQGEAKGWWPDGQPKFVYHFFNDMYEGELKEWGATGILYRVMNYKNGQEEGEQKLWYDNGQLRSNYVIKDGRRYGLLGTKNCVNVSDSIFK